MKTTTGVIVGAVIVVAVIAGVLSYQNNQKKNNSASLIIGVTDATASIADVNDVNLSVNKVEVHSTNGDWVSASSVSKSYKLLALNASAKTELYAKANVPAGTYDKVRLTLGDVTVNTKSKGDVKATLPSSYVVANAKVVVSNNSKTSLKLDVLADKSLHETSDGGYVFAPVVKLESKSNANVTIGDDNALAISGGNVDGNVSVGVDIYGKSQPDYMLIAGKSLKVESGEIGAVKLQLGGVSYKEDDLAGEAPESVNGSSDSKNTADTKVNANDSTGISNGDNLGNSDSSSVNSDLNTGIKLGQ